MPYIIKNGKTYTGNSVTLTQAQYDALSEAEKNNGVAYYIYDSDTVLDASDVSFGAGTVESAINTKANEDVIAAVEATSTATSTHAVGSYLLLNYNHRLYKVTSEIGVGDTISTSTNVSRVTVGGELQSVSVKKVTFTGTTNTVGRIEGAISDFGVPNGSVIVFVYFERGTYTARRSVDVLMYGNAGYGLVFTDNGTPVNTGSVTATIYYI